MTKSIVGIAAAMMLAACSGDDSKAGATDGGGDATSNGDATTDAGGDAIGDAGDGGVDNGEASTTYPAFMPPVPKIVLQAGGSVIAAPKLHAVYFAGETQGAAIDAAMTQYLASATWTAQTSEYGVGTATWTSTTLTETPPMTIDDPAIQTWLQGKLGGGDAGADPAFGATDAATLASTVYVLFYPHATTITVPPNTQSCVQFGSYHAETAVSGTATAYAVVPRCSMTPSEPVINAVFNAVVGSTDPRPLTRPAYSGFDPGHAAWALALGGGEVAQACQLLPAVPFDGGAIFRTWSNSTIAAYHDPCVPTPDTTPYFASVPIMNDDLTVGGQTTKGVKVAVGQSKTIELQLFSDGATSGPWTVSATLAFSQPAPAGVFALDRTSGTNGERLHLTITPQMAGVRPFLVVSKLGNKTTYWAGAFGQ